MVPLRLYQIYGILSHSSNTDNNKKDKVLAMSFSVPENVVADSKCEEMAHGQNNCIEGLTTTTTTSTTTTTTTASSTTLSTAATALLTMLQDRLSGGGAMNAEPKGVAAAIQSFFLEERTVSLPFVVL